MAPKRLPHKSALLREMDMFSTLLEHEMEIISEHSEFRDYREGEAVFRKDDPGETLYIVRSGEVLITRQEPYGPVIDIARYIQGNSFGELDMFTESSRSVSAHATRMTELLQFPKTGSSFDSILNSHPELSARILHKLLTGISGRIRSANTLIKENTPVIQELRKQVYRDKLTGIHNDTFLMERLRKMRTSQTSFALLMSKPDNFKELNDEYGHEAGDSVIRMMARGLRDFIGDDARTVRYKGNALAVILPEAGREEARRKAHEIQSFLGNLELGELTRGKEFCLSISVGISLCPAQFTDPEDLVFNTHELPLMGRRQGGGRILFPDDSLPDDSLPDERKRE